MMTVTEAEQVAREASRRASDMTEHVRRLRGLRDEVQARIKAGEGLTNPALFGEVRDLDDAWLWADNQRKDLDGRAALARNDLDGVRSIAKQTERRLAGLRNRQRELETRGSEWSGAELVTVRQHIGEAADLLASLTG